MFLRHAGRLMRFERESSRAQHWGDKEEKATSVVKVGFTTISAQISKAGRQEGSKAYGIL